MKSRILLFNIILILTLSCSKNQTIINGDLIKQDWISIEKRQGFFDEYNLLFIEDSLMYQTIIDLSERIVKYEISSDTLIIYANDFEAFHPEIKNQIYKYKIVELDSFKLGLKLISRFNNDTVRFKKIVFSKKNDLKIVNLEFSASICFGHCPAFDLKITQDSILYFYGYNSYNKYHGLYESKLGLKEFERIQKRIYAIPRDSFILASDRPDTQHYNLYIKSLNDSIEVRGPLGSEANSKAEMAIIYLLFIDRLLNLKASDERHIEFRDKYNYEMFTKK